MSNSAYVESVLAKQFTALRSGLSQTETVALMASIVRQLSVQGIKTVSIIGGAASGKSTIAEELVAFLQASGTDTDMLCTDNYAAGDRHYRQVKLKDADAQKKYDMELMDKHIEAIHRLSSPNQTVAVPVIDKETGIAADSDAADYPYEISKVDVLVIEGDFPRDDYDIRFYLHVPDMQRLQNNIEREAEQNDDIDPGKLTASFNDRQRTLHKPYTLPALQDADYALVADVSDDDWLYAMHKSDR